PWPAAASSGRAHKGRPGGRPRARAPAPPSIHKRTANKRAMKDKKLEHLSRIREADLKTMKDLARRFVAGGISRREFVERAAVGGLSLHATAAVLKAATTRQRNPNQTNLNPYEEWLRQEALPVYREYGIANLRTLDVKPWKRLNALGAYIDLKGGEGVNDGYVCEIAPGGSTTPQRYLFEEVLYISSGEGESVIWNSGGPKQSVKWQAGGG